MWESHTSMVARSVLAVVVILVAAGAAGVGFVAGYEYKTSPANSPAAVENSTLSVLAAGTLNTLFPQLASQLVNETPGITAPTATQTYEGSLDVTSGITTTGDHPDVAAVADFRLIPKLLEPTFAGYQI